MQQQFSITQAQSASEVGLVRRLFEHYAADLPVNLGYQGFEDELASLPGRYAAPRGCLLLAQNADGSSVACAGLRPLDEASLCEMKRLFVLPGARGSGLGRALALALIEEADRIGYQRMRLDTLVTMAEATTVYERLGFVRIPAYYAPVPAGTIFMELDLTGRRASRSARD